MSCFSTTNHTSGMWQPGLTQHSCTQRQLYFCLLNPTPLSHVLVNSPPAVFIVIISPLRCSINAAVNESIVLSTKKKTKKQTKQKLCECASLNMPRGRVSICMYISKRPLGQEDQITHRLITVLMFAEPLVSAAVILL